VHPPAGTLWYDFHTNRAFNLDYRRGEYATIPFSYDRATGTLTIGQTSGEFPRMKKMRRFQIRWMAPQALPGDDFTARPDATVECCGAAVEVHCASCRAHGGRA
jgi:alpha-D-xyloside xylohydrolase